MKPEKIRIIYFALLVLLLPPLLFGGCRFDMSAYVPERDDKNETESENESDSESESESGGSSLAIISAAHQNNTFGVGYVPEGIIDPMNTSYELNRQLSRLLYESLFTLSDDGSIVKGLCTHIESKDGINYALAIESGVTFHNGEPLTVDDVVYSLNRARSSKLYSSQLACISSVDGSSELGAVNISLRYELRSLPALLDIPIICRSDTLYEYSDYALLGSGRYYIDIEVLEETDYTYLQYNSNWRGYCGEKPAIARIDLFTVENKEDMLRRYFNSDIDIVALSSSDDYAPTLHGEAEIRRVTGDSLYYIGFNTAKASFSEVNSRLGISYLIDREELVSFASPDGLLAADSPIPRENAAFRFLGEHDKSDSTIGKALLKKAGFEDYGNGFTYQGVPFELTLLVNSDSDMQTVIGNYVCGILIEAGFTVKLSSLDYAKYTKALYNGSFNLYIGETCPPANYDYSYIIESDDLFAAAYSESSGTSHSSGKDKAPENIAETLKALRSIDCLGALYRLELAEATDRIMINMPFVPLCFDVKTVYIKGSFVSNVKVTQHDIYYNIEYWTPPEGK